MRSPTYNAWRAMVDRCTCPTSGNYERYGARGITVCDRWRSFSNFLADMGSRPEGRTIDRIDGSKGYEPGNCRWASNKEQARNKRTNLIVTYRGESRCVAEWVEILGLKEKLVRVRLSRGWSPERAFT